MVPSSLLPAAGPVPDLTLQVTPPRVPRDLLVRRRLRLDESGLLERGVVLVQAPAGFGKTSLMAQWRLEHLARGRVVAWLSVQAGESCQRLLQALVLAVRLASGRQQFGRALLEGGAGGDLADITEWLAEVAQSALDFALLIDGADRLSAPALQALTYLCHNLPANLLVMVAARADCDLGLDELATYGQCARLGARELRFGLEDTMALVARRLGERTGPELGARLHELTEGWPLGLQLALTSLARDPSPQAAVAALAGHAGELHRHFVLLLLANLDPPDVAFLEAISLPDQLHPDLCRVLTGQADAEVRLARLARDTPVFLAVEGNEWLRMHLLARDALRERVALRPPAELADLHARAAQWLSAHGLHEDAARHALAAGHDQAAWDLAEECLYEALIQRGRQATVLDWLARMPAPELDRRPRLMLAAAWALATSERHAEAEDLVVRLLAQAGDDPALRCECDLIRSGAAGFADQLDRFVALHDSWGSAPPLRNPRLLQVHANRCAFRALFDGDPSSARLALQRVAQPGGEDAYGYIAHWGEFVTGLSYVWEGQVILAEEFLRPALAATDADLGRRSPFACMLAALLAAAVWERDRPDDAAAILVNRLDVVGRHGVPEAVLLAWRTVARIAVAQGAEHRALALLEGLHAVGTSRQLPRLCIASLADQVRLNARRFRPESCRALVERIGALVAQPPAWAGPVWQRQVALLQASAQVHAAVAAQDWQAALAPAAEAERLAQRLSLGRARLEAMGLRALCLHRLGQDGGPLLRETADLAAMLGLTRLFADANPALGDWAQRVLAPPAAAPGGRGAWSSPPAGGALQGRDPGPSPARPDPLRAPGPRAMPSMALTPKEREVLELLARNLSNKEAARALQVGEETVKWHVKNLFGKLGADSRRSVVRKAQMLGLLEESA